MIETKSSEAIHHDVWNSVVESVRDAKHIQWKGKSFSKEYISYS